MELLGAVLTKTVTLGVDWRQVNLRLQADNCSKEVRNQTAVRLCAVLVSLHRVQSCTLSFLQSGHTHEDIDGLFASFSEHLGKHQ